MGCLEVLLGCAPPSPDPPELDDPAAWLSIPPAAKKEKKRLYLPAERTSPKSPAAGSKSNPSKHNEKNGAPDSAAASRFGGGRAAQGEAGKEVEEHGKKLGPCCCWSSLAKVTREQEGGAV